MGAAIIVRMTRYGNAAPALLLIALWCGAGVASADFAGAMSAYQRGDHATAAREARVPAEAGDADAQLLLGDLHASGRGVPQDFVLAHFWYNLAAANGAPPAAAARDALAARMTPAQVAEAQGLARNWRPASGTAPAAVATAAEAAEAQRLLARAGYDPGPADGKPGRRTRTAVQAFQRDAGLPVDGTISAALLAALRERLAAAPASGGALPAIMITSAATALFAVPDGGAGKLGELAAGSRVMTGELRGTWVQVRALPPARGVGWVDSYTLAPDPSDAPLPAGDVAGADPAPAEPPTDGGFFGGLARGVSSFLGGGASNGGNAGNGSTATIGIRGFDTSQLAAGRPNAAEFARLEGYAASPDEARHFAAEAGLQATRVAYLPDATSAPFAAGGTTSNSDRSQR